MGEKSCPSFICFTSTMYCSTLNISKYTIQILLWLQCVFSRFKWTKLRSILAVYICKEETSLPLCKRCPIVWASIGSDGVTVPVMHTHLERMTSLETPIIYLHCIHSGSLPHVTDFLECILKFFPSLD